MVFVLAATFARFNCDKVYSKCETEIFAINHCIVTLKSIWFFHTLADDMNSITVNVPNLFKQIKPSILYILFIKKLNCFVA